MRAATTTSAEAGPDVANHSPWTAPTAAARPRPSGTAPPHDVGAPEARFDECPLDDPERGPRLGCRIAGMERFAGWCFAFPRPGDVTRVAGNDRASVLRSASPTARRWTPPPGRRAARRELAPRSDSPLIASRPDRRGPPPGRDDRVAATASSRAARSVTRGTIESSSRYSPGA